MIAAEAVRGVVTGRRNHYGSHSKHGTQIEAVM
jgi:hypothetical protein